MLGRDVCERNERFAIMRRAKGDVGRHFSVEPILRIDRNELLLWKASEAGRHKARLCEIVAFEKSELLDSPNHIGPESTQKTREKKLAGTSGQVPKVIPYGHMSLSGSKNVVSERQGS